MRGAAKKRGMRVVARMSPDLNWGDALAAHPEWAMRNKDGSVQFSTRGAAPVQDLHVLNATWTITCRR